MTQAEHREEDEAAERWWSFISAARRIERQNKN
jgi:hypothetical protein